MRFPDNLLAEDEKVVLNLRPHWIQLLGPVMWFIVFAAVGVIASSAIRDSWGSWASYARWIVVALAVIVILWLAVIPWLSWITTHYVFTTHRLLLRSGIITRKGRDIPYARVNDVSFEQSVLQRMMALGTLVVQSASENGAVVFKTMPKVEMVQSTLYKLVEEDRDHRAGVDDSGGI
ncbi:MAG TPA: PH domain-containing protein [Stackebrandtia sp.]|jgi:uncharacterized membrane protein YdbT with pleckstrin-like domain|uniref:PH domain-containing protein n=1 Tax=Stackebrandtia sp. TaxID=2023065 RepID=UPI002D39F84C|nr:PH domain-containing protein [Stackebrandtia sp.]HZE41881.1 PH domain-containing protein [Stackebrandtia sp.]